MTNAKKERKPERSKSVERGFWSERLKKLIKDFLASEIKNYSKVYGMKNQNTISKGTETGKEIQKCKLVSLT